MITIAFPGPSMGGACSCAGPAGGGAASARVLPSFCFFLLRSFAIGSKCSWPGTLTCSGRPLAVRPRNSQDSFPQRPDVIRLLDECCRWAIGEPLHRVLFAITAHDDHGDRGVEA